MAFREGISVGTELDGRALPVSPRYHGEGPGEFPGPHHCRVSGAFWSIAPRSLGCTGGASANLMCDEPSTWSPGCSHHLSDVTGNPRHTGTHCFATLDLRSRAWIMLQSVLQAAMLSARDPHRSTAEPTRVCTPSGGLFPAPLMSTLRRRNVRCPSPADR